MRKLFFLTFVLLFSFGCKKKSSEVDYNTMTKDAFLVYSASANNLQGDLWANVVDVYENTIHTDNKHIYVFFKNVNKEPILYHVERHRGENHLIEIKKYAVTDNTATTEMMRRVIDDVNAEEYVTSVTDILFSSHGRSWLPDDTTPYVLSNGSRSGGVSNKNSLFTSSSTAAKEARVSVPQSPSQYSFGVDDLDQSVWMNIDDMADALESYNLNSITFDACYMGSIEVFYEFRNAAKYIHASPAEIWEWGMNYPEITKYFTQPLTLEAFDNIARLNYELYEAKSGTLQTGTFVVTATEHLEELATVVKDLLTNYVQHTADVMPVSVFYDDRYGYGHDYKLYLYSIIDASSVDAVTKAADRSKLDNIWAKAFPSYYHTDKMFNMFDITKDSYGVAGYVYHYDRDDLNVNWYFETTDWGEVVTSVK